MIHGKARAMHQTGNPLKFLLCLAAAAFFFTVGSASAADRPKQAEDLLRDTYHRNTGRLEKNSFGLPLFLDSAEHGDRVNVDVCGIFDHPFGDVLALLSVPANWCDIVSLHPNVKACTYREMPGEWLLTFYLGRKKYQPPEAAHKVAYRYRSAEQRQGYLDILLSASAGPFGTKDHRMRFEAIPLGGGKTFVRVGYTYTNSVALRLAETIYFATLGWGQEGVTVTGADRQGGPVYIGGPRGAIERNTVRYYLALQAFMDTMRYPEDIRFSMRAGRWYDATVPYRRQLFEMDKGDYLTFKTKEHMNQVRLQGSAGMGRQ